MKKSTRTSDLCGKHDEIINGSLINEFCQFLPGHWFHPFITNIERKVNHIADKFLNYLVNTAFKKFV